MQCSSKPFYTKPAGPEQKRLNEQDRTTADTAGKKKQWIKTELSIYGREWMSDTVFSAACVKEKTAQCLVYFSR